jgi:REP element-mobilizing transposase RayT
MWSTWDRMPLITPEMEPRLYAAITAKCSDLKCARLAIGGTADHIHLLVRLHAPVSVSELVKDIKGASSHLVTHEITPGEFFKWQGNYGALSVGIDGLPRLTAYIENQKQHHATGNTEPLWEQMTESK